MERSNNKILNFHIILKHFHENLQKLRIFLERNGFSVSTRLAELLGMKVKSVRLFFIYASFTTVLVVFYYI